MKICHFLLSNTFAGIEQHVKELAKIQSNHHEVSILCNKELSSFYKDFNVIILKNSHRRSLLGAYAIYNLLRSNQFDIVHSHGSKTTYKLAIVKNIFKFNFVATIHGMKTKTKIYNKADYVIGGSKKIISDIKINNTIIYNWYRSSSYVKQSSDYALAVGRLEKVKGFDLLIKAWEKIESPLLIVGSGKEREHLTNLIQELDLTHKITILDWVSQEKLDEIYSKASVLVISSLREGGPRVALEALANNLPVLSTDVGHMNVIIPNELLAQPNDLTSLENLLQTYVDNIETINQSAIFKFVREEFSLEKQSLKVIQVYDGLLKRSL